jgi:hypothetical protein
MVTSVMVSPWSAVARFMAAHMSAGTRTPWMGVLGWLGGATHGRVGMRCIDTSAWLGGVQELQQESAGSGS